MVEQDLSRMIRAVTVLVVAATAATWSTVGAARQYRLIRDDDDNEIRLLPTSVETRQIRGRAGRWELFRRLKQRLG